MPQSGLTPQPNIDGSAVAAIGHALEELRDLRNASAAALWAAATPGGALNLVVVSTATENPGDADVPGRFGDAEAAADWCNRHGWEGATVDAHGWAPGIEDRAFVAVAGSRPSGTSAGTAADLGRDFARAVRLVTLEPVVDQDQAMLAAVLENASDAIIAVDRDCRMVRHNPAAVALLGRAEGGPGGMSCGEYLGCLRASSPDGTGPASGDCDALDADASSAGDRSVRSWEGQAGSPTSGSIRCGRVCPFVLVLSGVTGVLTKDEAFVGPADARIPVSATYVRIPGREVGAVAIFRDLRAGHAIDELKSSFVAAVSHELRTPLALISGYAQSLLELELDDVSRRRFVERIDGTANRMRGLVDQLLDVATLESDRLAVDPRSIPLQPLLKSIIDEVAEMPGSLAVSLSVPPDLPPVYADPIRIGQVVANLLDNARKYGTAGSMVTVRVRRANDQAVVAVENDGPEIAPEERESVFERFYRGRDARSSGTPGIGLGLHLSRRLVEAHGGHIGLEDRPGGTCVSLTLPLALEGWPSRRGERADLDRPATEGYVANPSAGQVASGRDAG
ncbi:MAG: PAS domain-containing sensor histidine kinase [Candidatus Limnocylindrales bacterium]